MAVLAQNTLLRATVRSHASRLIRHARPAAAVAAILVFLGACGDSTGSRQVAVVEILAPAEAVREEQTLQLGVSVRDDRGREIGGLPVSWASSDAAVAVVDQQGVVTGVRAGETTISATAVGVRGELLLRVEALPRGQVVLAPHTLLLTAGDRREIVVVVLDTLGGAISDPEVAWSSSDTTVLRVLGPALVQALAPGTATLRATSGGVTGEAQVTVQAPASAGVRPDTAYLIAGVERTLQLTYRTPEGADRVAQGARWTSSDPAIVSVDSLGRVTAHGPGSATISAALGSLSGSALTIVVTYDPPLRFVDVQSQLTHGCGLTVEGTLYCWGSNQWGQLGTSEPLERCLDHPHGGAPIHYPCSAVPVRVDSPVRFTDFTVGRYLTCAVAEDGRAFCWGTNSRGLLGTGSQDPWLSTPRPVIGALRFSSLSTHLWTTCGVAADGAAYCWGNNVPGMTETVSVPTRVAGDARFASVAVGSDHACGLTPEGEAYCWGAGGRGQLGNGMTQSSASPVRVATERRFRSIRSADQASCALDVDGAAYCWGWGHAGALGTGSTESSSTPVPVSGGHRFTEISLRSFGGCGTLEDGRLVCWGLAAPDTAGAAPPPTLAPLTLRLRTLERSGPVCGIGIDGYAYCWGFYPRGDGSDPRGPQLFWQPTRVAGQ
jgi:alpha-tubulin suppressor-like RCC1 family protein